MDQANGSQAGDVALKHFRAPGQSPPLKPPSFPPLPASGIAPISHKPKPL